MNNSHCIVRGCRLVTEVMTHLGTDFRTDEPNDPRRDQSDDRYRSYNELGCDKSEYQGVGVLCSN